jgi:hypothetical protein
MRIVGRSYGEEAPPPIINQAFSSRSCKLIIVEYDAQTWIVDLATGRSGRLCAGYPISVPQAPR